MQRDCDSNMNRGKFPIVFVAIAAAVIAVVVIIVAVFAYFSSRNFYGNGYGYYGGYGMMGGFGGYWMLFMIPVGLIVLVVIGYAIWRGIAWGGGCGGHYGHYASEQERGTAMEILRRRYANGEITKEQFENMRKDILT
jgi:putative membrane protein